MGPELGDDNKATKLKNLMSSVSVMSHRLRYQVLRSSDPLSCTLDFFGYPRGGQEVGRCQPWRIAI